jgi:glycosyltransferase involved in cell wall biosynthesis
VALAILAGVALLVWIWLALFRGLFWRTDQRLPAGGRLERWPSLVVVVPARDEAAVLPLSLPTLVGQDYPGSARIVVVDDNSTDGTGTVAARLADAGGLPVTVICPGQPPPGWAGKVWALRAGVAEAGAAEFILLTDADIAHGPAAATLYLAMTVHSAVRHYRRGGTTWKGRTYPAPGSG